MKTCREKEKIRQPTATVSSIFPSLFSEMEEDNIAMASPSSMSMGPETVPELEGKVEQSCCSLPNRFAI
eukprot:5047872-Ditylum_brightwellii.AAC.1